MKLGLESIIYFLVLLAYVLQVGKWTALILASPCSIYFLCEEVRARLNKNTYDQTQHVWRISRKADKQPLQNILTKITRKNKYKDTTRQSTYIKCCEKHKKHKLLAQSGFKQDKKEHSLCKEGMRHCGVEILTFLINFTLSYQHVVHFKGQRHKWHLISLTFPKILKSALL